jgi:hypothetical protein
VYPHEISCVHEQATSSCAQLNSRARQDVGDEGAFGSRCIRAAALAMFLCKAQLQRLVLGREGRVASQGVAEGEPLAPQIAPRFGEMQAVRRL